MSDGVYLPNRAFEVLSARIRSLMIEANEVPRSQWSVRGEHNSDDRRACQIAADPKKYQALAKEVGM